MADEPKGSGPQSAPDTTPAAPGAENQPPEGGAQAGAAPAAGTEGQAAPGTPAAAKSFTQEELNAIVERRLAKERRRLERELALRQPPPAAPAAPNGEAGAPAGAEGKPQQAAFQDYDSYVEALGAWSARQTIAAECTAEQARTRTEREAAARAQFSAGIEQIKAAGMAKYDDFEEVTHDESVPITDHMLAGLLGSKAAPEVLYYLGKHPDETQTIASLSPREQIAMMGELRARLTSTAATPPAASRSNAPPPVAPVSTSAAAAVDPAKLEGDAYSEWRKARRAKYRTF